jgi:hypothetical protein
MVNPNRFYTYAYLREDKTPYYIGKGKKFRAYSIWRKGLKPPKDKSRIIFLKQNLTEEEAFKHEIYMISIFGRKDLGTGILHNRTIGGEGACGYNHTEETKILISNLHKGKKLTEGHKKKVGDSLRGKKKKPLSDETKKKLSEANKGKNNPNYGKSFSEEHRRKMSEAHKGKTRSEEHRRKNSEAKKGENHPFYGKKGKNHPAYGRSHSKEAKTKLSIINKGLKWWNDGNGNNKRSIECPGEGWVPGMTKRVRIS